jgi:hypothetical protein
MIHNLMPSDALNLSEEEQFGVFGEVEKICIFSRDIGFVFH